MKRICDIQNNFVRRTLLVATTTAVMPMMVVAALWDFLRLAVIGVCEGLSLAREDIADQCGDIFHAIRAGWRGPKGDK